MLTSGHVIDVYDDAEGKILADGELMKKYGGNLQVDTAEDVSKLPDGEFALVIMAKTGQKHRKFPIHTPDALAVSSHYFLKTASGLSEQAKTIAASNLLRSHLRFGAEAGEEIRKHAALENVVGPYANEAEPPRSTPKPAEPEKFALSKELLDGRKLQAFPLDTPEDVAASVSEFKKVAFELPSRDRYVLAHKLLRATMEGGNADTELAKFAGVEPNPAFMTHMAARREVCRNDTQRKVIDDLTKLAGALQPPLLAAAVEKFDRETGLHHYWDVRIRNPWDSCCFSKEAAVKVGDRDVTKKDIEGLIENGKLATLFKTSTINEFKKAPLEVFESLPAPTRKTIVDLMP